MELSRQAHLAPHVPAPAVAPGLRRGLLDRAAAAPDERPARRTLRAQIARLERELSDAFVTAFPMGGLDQPEVSAGEPRLLSLGELEVVRDELAERLAAARVRISEGADEQAERRLELERMLLDPRAYRRTRIAARELGDPGCGVWQVRPRLGLIGMLMGWWQVKLSSGCPLAEGRGRLVTASRPQTDTPSRG